MYAYVQFKFDSEKVHVPIENFKDSIQVERELRLGQRRPEYTCFWSFDEETPASFEKKEGRILDVDKLNSAEILKLKKKFKNGIPGWYNATLLQWDESLEELLEVATSSGSIRTRPTNKMTTIPGAKETKVSGKGAKLALRLSRERGRKANLLGSSQQESSEALHSNDGSADEPDSDTGENNMNSSDGTEPSKKKRACDSDEISNKKMRKSLESCEEKLAVALYEKDVLTRENEGLRKENEKLTRLNIYWQEKEMSRKNGHSSSSSSSHSRNKERKSDSGNGLVKIKLSTPNPKMAAANPISQTGDRADNTTDTSAAGATNFQEPAPATSSKNADATDLGTVDEDKMTVNVEEVKLPDPKTPLSTGSTGHAPEVIADTSDESMQDMKGILTNSMKSNAVTSPTTSKFKQQSKSSTMQKGGVAECAEAFAKECKAPINTKAITYEDFVKMCQASKIGSSGDSQFVKDCCSILWSDMELSERSAAGGVCPANTQLPQKKACTPEKKVYLRAILQCRIKNSVEAVKEEDMKDRLSSTRMNTYIKGKINTVIRAIKQQEK